MKVKEYAVENNLCPLAEKDVVYGPQESGESSPGQPAVGPLFYFYQRRQGKGPP